MNAQRALELYNLQERLELSGWRFAVLPPYKYSSVWCAVVWRDDSERRHYESPVRANALAAALHAALITEGAERHERDTERAPAMEAAE